MLDPIRSEPFEVMISTSVRSKLALSAFPKTGPNTDLVEVAEFHVLSFCAR